MERRRWRKLAAEEGVEADDVLQGRLCAMERVAAATGRELTDVSVRAFIKRCAAK